MDVYKVEYLSIINSKEDFCKSISSFNNFLQSYDNIKISGSKIKFEGASFSYHVMYEEIAENTQRFFHAKFVCEDAAQLDKFKAMLRSVRTLLSKASGKPPEVLWDDVSGEISRKAYPIIHELENLMRKLITKFMFIKIGLAWTKDAVPKEVSESIKTKREGAGNNFLYEVDFIQLSNFLFREYSTANSRKLVDKLGAAKKIEELDLSELQELVPRSNWERYFSPIVDCKMEYLQPRWEKLYALRCLVAHNNLISDADYEEVCTLSQEVKDKLSQALEGLDKVKVSTEQKEDVAENIATEINSSYAEFIFGWNHIAELIYHLAAVTDLVKGEGAIDQRSGSPMQLAKILCLNGVLKDAEVVSISELAAIRNHIVHRSAFERTQIDLSKFTFKMYELRSILSSYIENYSK